jgi:predicted pyridoxine 5'-phosphate oxidase superfamily flavin-nucleotide-binding protein
MDAQTYASDVAFSSSVKAIQTRKGSRASYHKQEERGWRTEITPDLAEFIAAQTSFLLATASADGQPYIQHRGGPAGFLKVIDERTLAFADFSGNRQYITQGNLAENAKAYIFIIDYLNRRRIKLWGTARVIENDPELLQKLMPENYQARPEQVIVFTLAVWDSNCPQHIPQKIDLADVVPVVAERDKRIMELEAEVARLMALVPA